MKLFKKDGVIKPQNKIELYITDNGTSTYILCPSEELLILNGWIEYKYEKTQNIKYLKLLLIKDINSYDKSKDVNSFYIGDIQAWIDRDTRVSLMNSTTILKNSGVENTTLWLNNVSYTIPCESMIQMLGALEIYALQCYNVTSMHIANVNSLETLDDIQNYNYKSGYPDKLIFTL